MIAEKFKKVKVYLDSEGKEFKTLEEAQVSDLGHWLSENIPKDLSYDNLRAPDIQKFIHRNIRDIFDVATQSPINNIEEEEG